MSLMNIMRIFILGSFLMVCDIVLRYWEKIQ